MLITGRHFPIKGGVLRWGGCSCHNTKQARRKVKKSAKQSEKKAWKKDQKNY